MEVYTIKKLDRCHQCKYCEEHQILTGDSFEHEHGIYCSLVEDNRDSWERHTYDGTINKKLISVDDWDVSSIEIPGWCPLLLKAYMRLASIILDSFEWKEMMDKIDENKNGSQKLIANHGRMHAKNVTNYACQFLEDIEKYCFENFFYREAWCSTKRNASLVAIAAILHDIGLSENTSVNHAESSTKIARERFLGCDYALISDEDREIILKAILNHSDGATLIEEAKRELRKDADGHKPALESTLIVPVALILADKLDITRERIKDEYLNSIGEDPEFDVFCEAVKKISKVEFRFVDPGEDDKGNPLSVKKAELHYVVDDGFNFNAMKFWPSCIRVPRMVAKDILGLRSFSVFVNGVRKNISDFKTPLP